MDSLAFWASLYSQDLVFRLTTAHERNIASFEILVSSSYEGFFQTIARIPAAHDSGIHTYEYVEHTFYPRRYLLAARDIYGCRWEFRDLMIYPGHGLVSNSVNAAHPQSLSLSSFPNPFNPTTKLSFTLPKVGRTTLVVYDLLGREVAMLTNGMMEAGEHMLRFDGSALPSGIYFARMTSGEFTATQKLLLLK